MSGKILVVDDDEFIRSVTSELLEQNGYAVETAENGLQAWTKINAAPANYDLMLLDKHMPEMDGIALLKRIKADARFVDFPVVMLTGDGKPEDISEGLAEGAFYYLTKPSPENVLKLIISNALKDFQQKRELRVQVGKQAGYLNLLESAEFRFRTLSEARDLALLLADASRAPERTVGGYSELLINAVEHGNLGITYVDKGRLLREDRWLEEIESRLSQPQYAAREVYVSLAKTNEACVVNIVDQGEGFDWRHYLEFSTDRAFDLHGRGIAMSKAIHFDALAYSGNGNSVTVTVYLPK